MGGRAGLAGEMSSVIHTDTQAWKWILGSTLPWHHLRGWRWGLGILSVLETQPSPVLPAHCSQTDLSKSIFCLYMLPSCAKIFSDSHSLEHEGLSPQLPVSDFPEFVPCLPGRGLLVQVLRGLVLTSLGHNGSLLIDVVSGGLGMCMPQDIRHPCSSLHADFILSSPSDPCGRLV